MECLQGPEAEHLPGHSADYLQGLFVDLEVGIEMAHFPGLWVFETVLEGLFLPAQKYDLQTLKCRLE